MLACLRLRAAWSQRSLSDFDSLEPLITDREWEHFDGFTPTFTHPSLSHSALMHFVGSAYTQFYMRPSFLANYLRLSTPGVRKVVGALDARVERRHARVEAHHARREGAHLEPSVP